MFNRGRNSEDRRCVSVRIAAWLFIQHSKQVMGLPVADLRDRQKGGRVQPPAIALATMAAWESHNFCELLRVTVRVNLGAKRGYVGQ
jgi:hypothetical protein